MIHERRHCRVTFCLSVQTQKVRNGGWGGERTQNNNNDKKEKKIQNYILSQKYIRFRKYILQI